MLILFIHKEQECLIDKDSIQTISFENLKQGSSSYCKVYLNNGDYISVYGHYEQRDKTGEVNSKLKDSINGSSGDKVETIKIDDDLKFDYFNHTEIYKRQLNK